MTDNRDEHGEEESQEPETDAASPDGARHADNLQGGDPVPLSSPIPEADPGESRATMQVQPRPAPLGPPPLPDLEPLHDSSRSRRSLFRRIVALVLKAIGLFILISVLWVGLYRFVNPPITATMIGSAIEGHGITKHWMPLSQIDPDMPRAAMAGEDSKFCHHHGFDFTAMEKAFRRNERGGHVIRGGSTISQQTAKNVFLWQDGGYFRKGLEAWFTVLIETIWGKKRIMEVYLNVAETGIGTYGVDAGAERYFGHGADRLSPHEAAQIAAVLPLPKQRPGTDPTGFTRRYGNIIAARMGTIRRDGLDSCLK